MNAANHFAVMPTKALKGTQSADANHWISLVFSSSNTGLQMELGRLLLLYMAAV